MVQTKADSFVANVEIATSQFADTRLNGAQEQFHWQKQHPPTNPPLQMMMWLVLKYGAQTV